MVNGSISRLRAERIRRGWSLTRLTQASGVDSSNLSLVERGLVPAYPGWQARIAQALELPADELFEGRSVLPMEPQKVLDTTQPIV